MQRRHAKQVAGAVAGKGLGRARQGAAGSGLDSNGAPPYTAQSTGAGPVPPAPPSVASLQSRDEAPEHAPLIPSAPPHTGPKGRAQPPQQATQTPGQHVLCAQLATRPQAAVYAAADHDSEHLIPGAPAAEAPSRARAGAELKDVNWAPRDAPVSEGGGPPLWHHQGASGGCGGHGGFPSPTHGTGGCSLGGDGGVRAVRALFDSYQEREVELRLRQAVFGGQGSLPTEASAGGAAGAPQAPLPGAGHWAATSLRPHMPMLPPGAAQAAWAGQAAGGACPSGEDFLQAWLPPINAAAFAAREAMSARDLLVGRTRPRPRPQPQPQLAPPFSDAAAGHRAIVAAAAAPPLLVAAPGGGVAGGSAGAAAGSAPVGAPVGVVPAQAQVQGPAPAAGGPEPHGHAVVDHATQTQRQGLPQMQSAQQQPQQPAHTTDEELGGGVTARLHAANEAPELGAASKTAPPGGQSDAAEPAARDMREASFAFALPLAASASQPPLVTRAGAAAEAGPGPAGHSLATTAQPPAAAGAYLPTTAHHGAAPDGGRDGAHSPRPAYYTGSPGAPPLAVAAVLACLRPPAGAAGGTAGVQPGQLPEQAISQPPHPPPHPLPHPLPQPQPPHQGALPLPVQLQAKPLSQRQPSDSSGSGDLLLALRVQQHHHPAHLPHAQHPDPQQLPDGAPASGLPGRPGSGTVVITPAPAAQPLLTLRSLDRVRRHPEHPENPGPVLPPARGRHDVCDGSSFSARWQAPYGAVAAAAVVAGAQAAGSGSFSSSGRAAAQLLSPDGGQSAEYAGSVGSATASVTAALADVPDSAGAAAACQPPPSWSGAPSAGAAAPLAASGGPGLGPHELQLQWQQWLHDPGVREAPGWPIGYQHSGEAPEDLARLEQHFREQQLLQQQQQMFQAGGLLSARSWPASGAAATEGPLTQSVVERLMIVNPLFAGTGGAGSPGGMDASAIESGGGGGALETAAGTGGERP
ncbi:hypothetical protein GPECTOR_36g63 [Gonium pectorale]|uniref:Uncharacterized protein n=1 Tax=Gonium pectorale TaxID=33097 RepID=A0A150GBY7_GONPE|nr:hypothetical protein GPECTOR_36g63 [Gonium pectorale]|eukprot:KXZ47339.1 hypothetical protein GPECTOR_36g63 [Gonium pectorale]